MLNECKMRFKLLTNFVNAYKDKMFLSNSINEGNTDTSMLTLEEMQKMHRQEKDPDITIDYEQFMKIFNG